MKQITLIAVGLFAAQGAAFAAGPAHSSADETGTVYHGPAYERQAGKLTRTDTWNRVARSESPQADPQWAFGGEETGWQLVQHGYTFSNGGVVHTDPFRHDTPKPKLEAQRAIDMEPGA